MDCKNLPQWEINKHAALKKTFNIRNYFFKTIFCCCLRNITTWHSWSKTQPHPYLSAEDHISILYADVCIRLEINRFLWPNSMPNMTAACFWFTFLASLAVGGKAERLKFWIPGTMNDTSVQSWLSVPGRLCQVVGVLNWGCPSYGRNCLMQSNWRILDLISNHSLSSWPNSCPCFIYVKLQNTLICFKFQPSTSLFRPFVFILFWPLKIRNHWFCHFASIDTNSDRAREILTAVLSTQMKERWFLGNVSLLAILVAHQSLSPSETCKRFVFEQMTQGINRNILYNVLVDIEGHSCEAESEKLLKF